MGLSPIALAEQKPILIGLIHFSPPLSVDMDFEPSLKHLQKFFYPRKVIAKVYSSEELEKKVETGEVDFFFASSGFYYRMHHFGARDIATVVTAEKPIPNFGTAGAFITRKERSDIISYEDMRNKTLAANYPSAFHGYRIGMADLEERGFNHKKFFRKIKFQGENADKLLEAVINKKVDVAFIRACWLEEHERRGIPVFDKLKVIEPREGPIACLHSTQAYPNNTFAATYKVDPELARQVAVVLLSMPPGKGGQHWSIATDFKPVDRLYKILKAGPYEYLNQWSIKRILQEFWPAFVFVFLSILGLILHSWRAQKLVEQATQKVLEVERSKELMKEKAQKLTEKMELQQKINLVGRLSSMFAHEMNQPLAATKYYIDGLKTLRCSQQSIPSDLLDYSLKGIDKEIQRASRIVTKVRQYSKGAPDRDQLVNISESLKEICITLGDKYRKNISITSKIENGLNVFGDPVEIEILCWNLLKNAIEESSDSLEKIVRVDLHQKAESVSLSITNSGRLFTEEQAKTLSQNILKSQKKEGLGLGLAVVMSIVEAMNSTIDFRPRESGGLIVSVTFPNQVKTNGI